MSSLCKTTFDGASMKEHVQPNQVPLGGSFPGLPGLRKKPVRPDHATQGNPRQPKATRQSVLLWRHNTYAVLNHMVQSTASLMCCAVLRGAGPLLVLVCVCSGTGLVLCWHLVGGRPTLYAPSIGSTLVAC